PALDCTVKEWAYASNNCGRPARTYIGASRSDIRRTATMSSPCNREQYSPQRAPHAPPAGAPPRGVVTSGLMDVWDVLRAAPDYDEEEMRGVGLPLYLPPRPDLPPAP